jgi:chorismate-pyruvate lyase
MNVPVRLPRPDLHSLFETFPPATDLPRFEILSADEMPEPFRRLLVHEHHMTVTVEEYHGDLVDVRILATRHEGNIYARKIVLPLQKSGKIVLFGIVRIRLDDCTPARDRIVEGKTPLGRILIEENILRRIEPTDYLRIEPGPQQLKWFGLTEPVPMYGRLAVIFCENHPAIELLEVVIA